MHAHCRIIHAPAMNYAENARYDQGHPKNFVGTYTAEHGNWGATMNIFIILLVLLLLFGGGGFYWGGPAYGGGGFGLVILIAIIVFLAGGFGSKT
jgi:hypothetical protein